MEMEFKDSGKRRRLLMIVVGALLALGAGWGSLMLATNGDHQAVAMDTQSVLEAAHDIPARTTVTADDVVVRSVPVDEAMPQSYTDPNDVIGHVNAVALYAGQQITPNLFATTSANSDFSILTPDEVVSADSPYWRAVALQIPAERAVGGEIQAGDHVDVFVSVQINVLEVGPDGTYQQVDTATQQGLQSGESTKITFQDIEVLKADPTQNMYVLKVDLHQAEQIYHVVQVAPDSFSLALRPDQDTRSADTSQYGETTDHLVMTYMFRVPHLLDLSKLTSSHAARSERHAKSVPGTDTGTGRFDPAGPDACAVDIARALPVRGSLSADRTTASAHHANHQEPP